MPDTIVIVDDEQNNTRIIQRDLEDLYYHTVCFYDGPTSLEYILNHSGHVILVILDRMMPEMDGLEVLAQMKKHKNTAHIPVVMQTAKGAQSDIQDGVDKGAYYYLVKPYERDVLLSLVQAAINDYKTYKDLSKKAKMGHEMFHHMKEGSFSFSNYEEINDLATFLSTLYPEPKRVFLGISELMLNALVHGNLRAGISKFMHVSDLARWEAEIKKQQMHGAHLNKKVYLTFEKGNEEICLTIRDEGSGFDWRPYLLSTKSSAANNHPHGIFTAKTVSFDKLKYNAQGNEVKCIVFL